MQLNGVTAVEYDSRRVRPGACFVAMRGETTDGNRYLEGAIARGATMVLTDSATAYAAGRERWPELRFELVQSGRRALAEAAAQVLGHPEQRLAVSAVTGTNGKTTTAWLLEQMLDGSGRGCVLVGTIETHVGGEVRASEHTTPEASDLLRTFADGVAAGCTEAVMEMSSHALAQERVWGVPVDVAVFTNLTQDHLDFHGSMEAYGAAKARLFSGVGAPPPRVAVINGDDAAAPTMLRAAEGCETVMRYGIGTGEYRAERLLLLAGRTSFLWHTPLGTAEVELPLTGRVNVYNWMAAACAALARGLSMAEVLGACKVLEQVPGRFQVVKGSLEAGFAVVVDYAHTEDALRNLLLLARDLVGNSGRVITLFGCGGDRDRTKRPRMGRAAVDGSDLVILTSDNPRSEDAQAILAEIVAGTMPGKARVVVEEDRARAIHLAVDAARAGDIVLIAGKGHEQTQTFRDRTVRFDDVEVAAGALRPAVARVEAEVATGKEEVSGCR